MKKRKLVVLDCDDVLLDYIGSVSAFAKKHYDIETVGLPSQYELSNWLGTTPEMAVKILEHFNYHSYEFGLLPALDDSTVSFVQKLIKEHSDDTDFIIVTKSGNEGHAEVLRKVNLHNVFGDVFTSIIMISPHESKKHVLKKLMKSYEIVCFVDDNIDNVKIGVELGITTLMVERSHNLSFSYDKKFKEWNGLYNEIKSVLK